MIGPPEVSMVPSIAMPHETSMLVSARAVSTDQSKDRRHIYYELLIKWTFRGRIVQCLEI